MDDSNPPIDPEFLRRLEFEARAIAKIIDQGLKLHLKAHIGFTLTLFRFDGSEFTYVSNANRLDVIRMLEETVNHLRNNASQTSAEKN